MSLHDEYRNKSVEEILDSWIEDRKQEYFNI